MFLKIHNDLVIKIHKLQFCKDVWKAGGSLSIFTGYKNLMCTLCTYLSCMGLSLG